MAQASVFFGVQQRRVNPSCPEEVAAMTNVQESRGAYCPERSPHTLLAANGTFRCCREPGHSGPHITTSGGGRWLRARWIEE